MGEVNGEGLLQKHEYDIVHGFKTPSRPKAVMFASAMILGLARGRCRVQQPV